ncbi:MerR family transcriptional regulator [Jidongwangia harbinensis]|uniref:MerR family transcriptional regulator n=1 Tax=Jidongwangia harbinensis TaxID=2878561 RepID=UPI001CD9D155|nr:MerR family transcriptional regulator [Jidongwangia harbinensis]MCA2212906.1 MerR family transcriptional regulator [Jidongwangia harbinensis]
MADEALTAGAVARRLGVAVTTLRTWHQRYGLGPSQHVAGQHRRYTPQDMERLQVMRRLTAQGVTPAEAASWARRVPISDDSPEPPPGPESLPPDAEPLDEGFRDGGGHTIPVGRAGATARGLARAAMRLDAQALRDIITTTIADRGVVRAWDEAIMPVLVGVGERYAASLKFIEVEHLISRSVTEALSTVDRKPASTSPRVLLTAADEEQHTLPLEALAAALAEAGVPTRLLGARVPPDALGQAVARTGPAVVVLWSQLPETGDPRQLARLLIGPRRPMLVAAAGPGWHGKQLPDEVPLLGSLTDAVRVITAAAAE